MEVSIPKLITQAPTKKNFVDFSIDALLSKKEDNVRVQRKQTNTIFTSEVGQTICESLTSSVDDNSDDNLDVVSVCPTDSTRKSSSSEKRTFDWLQCTRFKPPKLMRSRRKSASKRNGRGPRIPFSTTQLSVLEKTFKESQYLCGEGISRLADTLHLTETRVKIWFQNRRARFRRERNLDQEINSETFSPEGKTTHLENTSCHRKPICVSSSKTQDVDAKVSSSSNPCKQSFRHLINDLNLIAARTASASSTSNSFHLQHLSKPKLSFTSFAQIDLQAYTDHNIVSCVSSSVR